MNYRDSPDETSANWHDGTFLSHRVFAGLEPPYSNLQQARVVILTVPYDCTSEWHSGSRQGPQAIIDASQYLELYDWELDREIYKIGICTFAQVEPVLSSPQDMIDRVYEIVKGLIRQRKFVVMLGGEHSLSLGAIRAFKAAFPRLSVLQLDAHADLRDEYLGTRYGQACVMRRVSELCPICQVGVRSLSLEEKQFLAQNKVTSVTMSGLASGKATIDRILDSLGQDVYVTIDVDVLDPSIMSAVGTPEPDGMSWRQILDIADAVMSRRHIVGFDLMEFCPREGPASCAYLIAKLAYKLIGYSVPQEGR